MARSELRGAAAVARALRCSGSAALRISGNSRGQIERLSIEPDTAVLATARERLRPLENIDERQVIGAVRAGMVSTRSGVLDDLRETPDDGIGFQRRLADLVALYEKWQIRFDGR